jgi:hypothetical protein
VPPLILVAAGGSGISAVVELHVWPVVRACTLGQGHGPLLIDMIFCWEEEVMPSPGLLTWDPVAV